MGLAAKQAAVFAASAAMIAACVSPDRQLRSLAADRLALAPDVAWAKFHSNQPLHDPVREASILSRAADPVERRFFADQMAVSRLIQSRLVAAWKSGAPQPEEPPRSLTSDIRPAIDRIDRLQRHAIARGAKPPSLQEIEGLAQPPVGF